MAPTQSKYPNFNFGSLRLKSQDVMERLNGTKQLDQLSERSDVRRYKKEQKLSYRSRGRESCDQSQNSTLASQMPNEDSPKITKRRLKKDLTEIKDKESDEDLTDSSDDDTGSSEEEDTNSFNYYYRTNKCSSRGKSEEKPKPKY